MANIKSRFFASFVANLIRSVVTVATGILLARWLGPTDYGRMSFLLAAFTALRGMLDLGSSTAFFTLLSRRQRSKRFIAVFWGWIAIQLVVALLFLLLLMPDSLLGMLWAGESRSVLALAFLAAFMQGTVWTLAAQMAEASRQTIRGQQINTLAVMLHLIVVIALALLGKLAITLVFVALIIEWAIAAWFASRLYVSSKVSLTEGAAASDTPKSMFREFFVYCAPLIPVMLLGFVHDFADRWMLQTWGGAKEQAYFSVAQQYSAVALLATVSVLRILWKEVAEAHHQQDMQRLKVLYQRASRLLFFVGAFVAGGLQPLAPEILRVTVGQDYLSGTTAMAIMLLYPVHQSMGQIGGTMLFATGHTRVYALSGSLGMLVSLVAAYLVLAPTNAAVPGLQLGANGLALKLVFVQIFSVSFMAWMIARTFGWHFDWKYQIFALLGCVGLGWSSHLAVWSLLGENGSLFLKLPLMALLYIGLVSLYVYFSPWLLSMTRSELKVGLTRLKALVKLKWFEI